MKFDEYISESLAAEIKSEPKTAAAKQAKKLGLKYAGFGRYADRSGNIAYMVHGDKLLPYKKRQDLATMYSKTFDMPDQPKPVAKKGITPSAVKPDKKQQAMDQHKMYDSALSKREREDMAILKKKSLDARKYKEALTNFYKRKDFDSDELNAIQWYTGDGYEYINKYLYKGHDEGATYQDDTEIKKAIQSLDSAFEDTEAPFKYNVYTGLSDRYSSEKFQPGGEYVFRGYVSTSLDYETSIDGFAKSQKSVVLQVEIQKGQKAIFVDSLSSNPGEGETILPRGSRIKIISGPHPIERELVSMNGLGGDDEHIHLFHCKIIEDK